MFQRKTSGSVVCPSCGSLVGVRDDKCYMCGRANPGLWGFGPALRDLGGELGFAEIVIGGSTVLYVLSLVVSGAGLRVHPDLVTFFMPSDYALLLFGISGAVPTYQFGEWWTLFSASWLHLNFLHILFNMMWIRQIGPAIADIIGSSRTIIIYTVSGVCGFLLSSTAGLFPVLHGAAHTAGASASIFGLFGALVHYGGKGGGSLIRAEAMRYVLPLFVFGLIMPGVDNYAHAGGFLGGYAASAVMNPLTRERGDHLIIAAGCLLVSILAVAFAVVYGLTNPQSPAALISS